LQGSTPSTGIKTQTPATDYKTMKKSQPIYVRKPFINIKMSKEPACYYKSRQIINEGICFLRRRAATLWVLPNIFVRASILKFFASSGCHESNYYPFRALVEKKICAVK